MDAIRFDFAAPDDLPSLVDLLGELFRLESDFEPDPAKQEKGLRLILEQPESGRIFVARAGCRAVAMASLLLTVSTAEGGRAAILEDVIVSRAWRGKGLGKLLLEHAFLWGAENGCLRITVLADRDNAGALGFYRGLGFQPSAMTVLRRFPA